MKLQQLRYLREVARRGLNVSEAAEALHTSQPGVSASRSARSRTSSASRSSCATASASSRSPSRARRCIAIAERILAEAAEPEARGRGVRATRSSARSPIATTHTQARYALPQVGGRVQAALPEGAAGASHQGNPTQICEHGARRRGRPRASPPRRSPSTRSWCRCRATSGTAAWSCRRSIRCSSAKPLTLEAIAQLPDRHLRLRLRRPLADPQGVRERAASTPNVVLTALDSDVIKTYVELGLGVGILAKMAFDPKRDRSCARSTRATCSSRAPRASASSAAPTCGATPTSSSSCSRRSCRARWWSAP